MIVSDQAIGSRPLASPQPVSIEMPDLWSSVTRSVGGFAEIPILAMSHSQQGVAARSYSRQRLHLAGKNKD